MDSSITQNYPAKIAKINKEVPELCIQCFEVMCDAGERRNGFSDWTSASSAPCCSQMVIRAADDTSTVE